MKKILIAILTLSLITAVSAAALAAGQISLEEAKTIALDKASLTADAVTFLKAHPDYDDGRPTYEIKFFSDHTEYEFEIDAQTGRITEYDTEVFERDFAARNVTEEEARQIALAHAGFREEDVRFTKCHLDRDDGRVIYEIEFTNGGMEYEFDIDTASGRILEYSVDRD
ncbi:MAG: PepSY domain-containing protein [Clostridia bacterium]|nr:PepSY domain-containing protein [Clostridia bacterium]